MNAAQLKTCSKCLTPKPIDLFHNDKSRGDGKCCQCKACQANWRRRKRATDPEWTARCRARSALNRKNNPEKFKASTRNATLKNKYGITSADFDAMLESQGGVCAACGSDEPRGYGTFHVDHCHKTGRVRALLCQPCNTTLGKFDEDAKKLRALAAYIEQHTEG